MKNCYAISDVCRQIEATCKKIGSLTEGIEMTESNSNDQLLETYEDLRFGELEHLQRLTLALTQLITQEDDGADSASSGESVNEDDANGGSVFAEGDLASDIGDKTDDEPKAE